MDKLNQVDQTQLAPFKYFSTLTYPDQFPRDRKLWVSHRRAFEKRVRRRWSIQAMVWKLEPQKRLAPHYHYLIFAHEEIPNDELALMWHEIAGGEDPKHLAWHRGELGNGNKPCTTEIEFFDGVKAYVAKYCSKDIEGDTLPSWWRGGRFWGGMQGLPISIKTVEMTPREAFDVRRLMRRLYESKTGNAYKTRGVQGVKLYCKQETTEKMLTWATQREQERVDLGQHEQAPLHEYRKKAARGMFITGKEYAPPPIDMKQAEQDYRDRLHYYGQKEKLPEDCRTVLEKFGFVGLEERINKTCR